MAKAVSVTVNYDDGTVVTLSENTVVIYDGGFEHGVDWEAVNMSDESVRHAAEVVVESEANGEYAVIGYIGSK